MTFEWTHSKYYLLIFHIYIACSIAAPTGFGKVACLGMGILWMVIALVGGAK